MDQLKKKIVNVMLIINEGRGLDFIRNPMIIAATFNGRTLESDQIFAQNCSDFNTNFLWEIEKIELRKIRSAKQLLRIDCITLGDDHRRVHIGHVLLDLRSAYVGDVNGSARWVKILGCRKHHPELKYILSIMDNLAEPLDNQPILTTESIKQQSADYIKIGSNPDESFTLTLFVEFAANLDVLLPEIVVFNQYQHKYFLSFEIFGTSIKLKQFNEQLYDKIMFDEKIMIKIRSTWNELSKFFENQQINSEFYCGTDKLGITTIKLNTLLDQKNFSIKESYFFKFPSPNGIIPEGTEGRKPFIQIQLTLDKIDIVLKESNEYNWNQYNFPEKQINLVEQHNYGDCDKKMLIQIIFDLKTDNQKLKNTNEQLNQDLEFLKKSSEVKEQTLLLLTELQTLEENFIETQYSLSKHVCGKKKEKIYKNIN